MKKMFLLALAAVPLISSAQNTPFIINGKITSAIPDVKAYLVYQVNGKKQLDSTQLHNGSFTFKGTVAEPVGAQLLIDHNHTGLTKIGPASDILSFYLEKGTIRLESKDSVKNALISGSAVNAQNVHYKELTGAVEKEIKTINATYAAASPEKKKDAAFTSDLRTRLNKATAEKTALQQQYISKNPDSFISLNALNELITTPLNLELVEPLYTSLSPGIRKSASGMEIGHFIDAARATAIGAIAPVFTLNDVNDKPVSLTDFRGKYVLLDFWASWCGPCRAENPNVVNAYHQYQNKNFTVVGVSLDQPGKKEAWLEAIKADKLEWTQLSDLKFWNSDVAKLYGIRAIPQNYLIDPDGKIIGKNLRGDALNKKLAALFN